MNVSTFQVTLCLITLKLIFKTAKFEKIHGSKFEKQRASMTVVNASEAITLQERDLKNSQALSGIRTHELCNAGAVLYQLSYQSHMRAVV